MITVYSMRKCNIVACGILRLQAAIFPTYKYEHRKMNSDTISECLSKLYEYIMHYQLYSRE